MDEAENHINDFEHKEAINNQSEQQEGKRIHKNEDGRSSLWHNFKENILMVARWEMGLGEWVKR